MSYMLIAIDPGVKSTGVAWGSTAHTAPTGVTSLHPVRRTDDWAERAREIADQLYALQMQMPEEPERRALALEMPVYGESNKFRRAARSGSLVKLSMLAGVLFSVLREYPVQLIPVHEWKGNLPKKVSTSRTRKALRGEDDLLEALEPMPDDAWDATGIWLFSRSQMLESAR